jgi:hypothetical protein
MGSCVADWEASHNEWLPDPFAISNPQALSPRIVTESKAIAVEYSVTQLGRTIIAPLAGMCRWAKRYRKDVSAEVRLRGAEIG